MIDRQRAVYTQSNNVLGTINVLYAIKVTLVAEASHCSWLINQLRLSSVHQRACMLSKLLHRLCWYPAGQPLGMSCGLHPAWQRDACFMCTAQALTLSINRDTRVCPMSQEFNPDCHLVKLGTMGEYGECRCDCFDHVVQAVLSAQ